MSTPRTENWLQSSPILLLHRAVQYVNDVFSSEFRGNLTPRQYAVLAAVADNESLIQAALAERTKLDRSSLNTLTPRIVKMGLLKRRRAAQDSRTDEISLMAEARRTRESAAPAMQRIDEHILSVLPKLGREPFMTDLRLVIDAFSKPSSERR